MRPKCPDCKEELELLTEMFEEPVYKCPICGVEYEEGELDD